MNPHLTARLRLGLLIFVAIILQTAIASDLRVAGVAPDVMLLITILAGLTGGTDAGAWVGFFAGVATDLFLTSTPMGLSALTYLLIGATVGALRAGVLPESRILGPLVAFAATALGIVLFIGIGDMMGQSQLIDGGRSWIIRVCLIEGTWSAVLAIPVGWVYAKAARGSVGSERLGPPKAGSLAGERFGERLTALTNRDSLA